MRFPTFDSRADMGRSPAHRSEQRVGTSTHDLDSLADPYYWERQGIHRSDRDESVPRPLNKVLWTRCLARPHDYYPDGRLARVRALLTDEIGHAIPSQRGGAS